MMVPFFLFITFLQPGILFPWLAPYRVQLAAGILAAIIGALFGRFRFEKKEIHICVLIFYLAQILSVYYSGFSQMADEALAWFPLISVFFLVALSVDDESKLKNCIWGFLIGAAAVILYGLSRLWWDPIAQIRWIIGAYGMYQNQNDYSFIIIFSFPFWLWFMLHYRSIFLKLLCLNMIIFCVIGIIISLSRGGALTFVLENLLFFWFYLRNNRARFFIIPIIAVLSVFVIIFVWDTRETVQKGIYSYEDSKDSRSDIWGTGKREFLDNPVFGVGSRRFSEYTKEYMPSWASYAEIKGKNAHNTYIEVLATSGLLGFIPFICSIYISVKVVYQRFSNFKGWPRDNLSLPIFVASISYFFRALFDSKVTTPEFFFILAICSIQIHVNSSIKT